MPPLRATGTSSALPKASPRASSGEQQHSLGSSSPTQGEAGEGTQPCWSCGVADPSPCSGEMSDGELSLEKRKISSIQLRKGMCDPEGCSELTELAAETFKAADHGETESNQE